jgi:hypothetical protein
MRSIITACDWRIAASKSRSISIPGPALAAISGSNSFGPQSSTRAPSRGSSSMFERATRLCRMSPTIVTVTPASVFAFNCVANPAADAPGSCAGRAAPAWDARACRRPRSAPAGASASSSHAAPEELWRRMMASAPSARSVRPVSFSDLALFDARAQARDQRGVGAQRLGGQLEAGAGARGRLVEKQRDAALGQNAVAEQRVKVFELRGAARSGSRRPRSGRGRKQRSRMVRKWRRWRGRSG